jgi:hypothetical protein
MHLGHARKRDRGPPDAPKPCHASLAVVWIGNETVDFQRYLMGGTGLEPVTPSLSIRPRRSLAFATAFAFSGLCRSFTVETPAAFALVCALPRTLVVARGSTVRAHGELMLRGPRYGSALGTNTATSPMLRSGRISSLEGLLRAVSTEESDAGQRFHPPDCPRTRGAPSATRRSGESPASTAADAATQARVDSAPLAGARR